MFWNRRAAVVACLVLICGVVAVYLAWRKTESSQDSVAAMRNTQPVIAFPPLRDEKPGPKKNEPDSSVVPAVLNIALPPPLPPPEVAKLPEDLKGKAEDAVRDPLPPPPPVGLDSKPDALPPLPVSKADPLLNPPVPLPIHPNTSDLNVPVRAAKTEPAVSPWTLQMEIVNGKTRLTARIDKVVQFTVTCDSLALRSPHGDIKAEGHVRLESPGLEGTSDKLLIPLEKDQVILEGQVNVRTTHEGHALQLQGQSMQLRLQAPLPRPDPDMKDKK